MSGVDDKIQTKRLPIVVNIFGGPGSGKSTLAAEIFARLKVAGINCELVTEFAKDMTWEHNKKALSTQPYILGNQYYRMMRAADEVDVIVTDSPLLLSILHNKDNRNSGALMILTYLLYNDFTNLNYFLGQPCEGYCCVGRNETASEAQAISTELKEMLDNMSVPYDDFAAYCGNEDNRAHNLGIIERAVRAMLED